MNAPEALRALGTGPLLLTGSGAPLLAKEARARGVPVRIASERPAPDIALVARLGLAAQPDTAPARPLYLKEPDVTMPSPRSDPQKDAAALGEAAARARAAATAQA